MRVLIFSSSAGNGHNSTAKRLTEKILEDNPDAVIETIDTYKAYASKFKAWTMEQGYFLACNYFLKTYNYFFKKSEKCTYEKRNSVKANKESYCIMYGMLKKIYDFKPDIIISTYIFCSIALTNLRRFYNIPAKIICMTLDYGISPYWECCSGGLDYMFLTGEYMIKPFKEKGFCDKQLVVSGIPVAEKFEKNDDKLVLRKKLNLETSLYTMIIMKASFFPVSNAEIIKQLKKINKKIQIIIVNGKDKKNELDMKKRISKANLQHSIINLGFINNIEEYLGASDLVLGKAGGLSSTESINAGVPTLILNKLPQQEIYNKEFLVNNSCAIEVTKNNIAETINRIIGDETLSTTLSNATTKVRKLNTLNTFAKVINNCPPADYSNLSPFTDSKKMVIKNVDRERKKAIAIDKKKLKKKF